CAEDGGNLFDLQPAEEMQLDDARLARVFLLELLQGVAERDQIHISRLRDALGAAQRERDQTTAALVSRLLARVIDQDVAHRSRRDADEVRAALPLDVLHVEKL